MKQERSFKEEKIEFLSEIKFRTIQNLNETLLKISECFNNILRRYEKEYKESFMNFINQLQNLCEDEFLKSLTTLKEQIRDKHMCLSEVTTQVEAKINPMFDYDPKKNKPQIQDFSESEVNERQQLFRKTIKPHNRKDFGCPKCLQNFEKRHKFSHHLIYRHNLTLKFKCPHCDYTVGEHQNLAQHLIIEHMIKNQETNKMNYVCPYSSYTFLKKVSLQTHIRNTFKYRVYEEIANV